MALITMITIMMKSPDIFDAKSSARQEILNLICVEHGRMMHLMVIVTFTMWTLVVDNGINKKRIQDSFLDMLVPTVGVPVKVIQIVNGVELKVLTVICVYDKPAELAQYTTQEQQNLWIYHHLLACSE